MEESLDETGVTLQFLRAWTGSMRVARIAGRYDARSAVDPSIADTTPNVSRSVLEPKSNELSSREMANAPTARRN